MHLCLQWWRSHWSYSQATFKHVVAVLLLGKDSLLKLTTRNLTPSTCQPVRVWFVASPITPLPQRLLPWTAIHFLDPPWNSYSLSKSALKQLLTLSTPPKWRQWKVREGSSTELSNPHEARKTFASFLCVDFNFFIYMLMVCCILSKKRYELYGGRNIFTVNHCSS